MRSGVSASQGGRIPQSGSARLVLLSSEEGLGIPGEGEALGETQKRKFRG